MLFSDFEYSHSERSYGEIPKIPRNSRNVAKFRKCREIPGMSRNSGNSAKFMWMTQTTQGHNFFPNEYIQDPKTALYSARQGESFDIQVVSNILFSIIFHLHADAFSHRCNATSIIQRRLRRAPFDSTLSVDYPALNSSRKLFFKRDRRADKLCKNQAVPSSTSRNFLQNEHLRNPKAALCSARQGESSGVQHVLEIPFPIFSKFSARAYSQGRDAAHIKHKRLQ